MKLEYNKKNSEKKRGNSKSVVLIHPFAKTPPFGIMSIASFLKKHGKKVRIVDYTHGNISKKQILNDIKGADIIGISVYTMPMLKHACRITKIIRKEFKGFLVWGGVHATLFPEKSIKEMDLDGVIVNEGEITFLELVDAIEKKKPIEKVKSIVIKKGKNIIFTEKREPIYDMSILPKYDWRIINPEKYITKNLLRGRRSILLVESRGCPFNCAYCYVNKMFGCKWRGREPDEIISEMVYLNKKYNITHFDFLDDLPFGGKKNKMLKFCNKLAPLNFSWTSDYRVNCVDRDVITAMKKANCKYIYFGIESGSLRILKMINRNMTIEMAENAFSLCNEIGISTMAGFIAGFPTETEEDLKLTIKVMKKLKPTLTRVTKFVPYPGGELYEKSIEMGFKLPKKTEGFADLGDYVNEGINISSIPDKKIRKARNFARFLSIKNTILFSFKHKDFGYMPYFILDSLPPRISRLIVGFLRFITKPIRTKS